mmetsp:Transcript_13075/g.22060  ORF Transcript_13075/g.22060 Transcript_13075/m.22060 type:complete len:132 (+) Transcript_13075:136-531(+)
MNSTCISPVGLVGCGLRASPARPALRSRVARPAGLPTLHKPNPQRLARLQVRAEEERKEEQPKTIYADEAEDAGFGSPNRETMSEAQKAKLRAEYYGLGGSPNKPMSSNLFLNIIIVISLLAVTCAFLGYI